jgi:hypothetical protein
VYCVDDHSKVMGKANSKHPGRDKEAARREQDRERKRVKRAADAITRPKINKRCTATVRCVGARQSVAVRPHWRAEVQSIVEVLSPSGSSWGESPYCVVAVTLLAGLKLIALLVPKLQQATGGGVVVARRRRALGVIFSRKLSYSSLHRDPDDSLIVCIAGQRSIWVAAPAAFGDRVIRKWLGGDKLTGVVCLPDEYDPALPGPQANEVEWTQFTLSAGDVLFIPRGWWHSVRAVQGSIALAVETRKDSVAAWIPTKFTNVGRTRNRCGWRSAARCMQLWEEAVTSCTHSVV